MAAMAAENWDMEVTSRRGETDPGPAENPGEDADDGVAQLDGGSRRGRDPNFGTVPHWLKLLMSSKSIF